MGFKTDCRGTGYILRVSHLGGKLFVQYYTDLPTLFNSKDYQQDNCITINIQGVPLQYVYLCITGVCTSDQLARSVRFTNSLLITNSINKLTIKHELLNRLVPGTRCYVFVK